MLELVQQQQEQFLRSDPTLLPIEVMAIPPKISKGENYKGLPYFVLDYPRHFGKDDHLAIRTMFWWGNFFSVTLHLSGSYKGAYQNKIETLLPVLKKEGFFICVGGDPWQHHFETDNYHSLDEMTDAEFKDCIRSKEFIKLAQRFALEEWDNAVEILLNSFRKMIQWLKD